MIIIKKTILIMFIATCSHHGYYFKMADSIFAKLAANISQKP